MTDKESEIADLLKQILKKLDTINDSINKNNVGFNENTYVSKREIWWVLWGVAISIGVQIFYDAEANFPT